MNGSETQLPLSKRLLAALFALVLVVGMVPVSAWAEGDEAQNSGTTQEQAEDLNNPTQETLAVNDEQAVDETAAVEVQTDESTSNVAQNGGGTENLANLSAAVPASDNATYTFDKNGGDKQKMYAALKQTFGDHTYRLDGDDTNMKIDSSSSGYFAPKSVGTFTYTVEYETREWWHIWDIVWKDAGTLTFVEKPSVVNTDVIKDGFTYDGNSHEWEPIVQNYRDRALTKDTDYSVTYKRNGEVTNDFTSAGTIDVHIEAYNGYTGTFDYSYTINPADVTVSIEGNTKTTTYDAHEQFIEGYTVSAPKDSKYNTDKVIFTGTEAKAAGTDVGTYTMGLKAENFDNTDPNYNVTFNVTDGNLVIDPANTMTVSCEGYAGTYDGEEHTPTATASVPDGTDATIEYSLDDKEWTKDAPSIKDAGEKTVYVRATNSNYVTAESSYTLKVAKAKVTVSVEGTTKTTTYNGSEQKAEGYKATGITGDATGNYSLDSDFELKAEGSDVAKGTNVDTYAMGLTSESFVNKNGNYEVEFNVTDGKLVIDPANTMTVSCEGYAGTYDGEEHTPTATASVPDGTDATIEYSLDDKEWTKDAPSIKDAGEKTVYVRATNSNYVTAESSYTLKVAKAKVTVSVEGTTKTTTYNGSEQKAEGYKATGITGDATGNYSLDSDFELKAEGSDVAKGTNVDTYAMGLTSESFVNKNGNYEVEFNVTDGKLVVEQAKVTVSVAGNSETKTYSGEEQSVEGYKVTGVDGDASDVYSPKSIELKEGAAIAKGTKVGTYDMGLASSSFTNTDANFVVTFEVADGKLAIDPANVTVTADAKSKVYGDEDPEFTAQVDGLVNGESEDLIKYVIFRSNEDEGAGTYKGVIELEGEESQGNYAVSFVPADFTIDKRAIEVSDSATYAYNGQEQALSIDAAKVTNLVDGDRLYLNNAQVKGTEPGTYTDLTEYTWDVVNDEDNVTANYDLKVSGELTITAAADGGNGSAADNGNADKANGSSSAKTGDSTAPFAAGAGIVAAAAALAAFLVSRRLRGSVRQ